MNYLTGVMAYCTIGEPRTIGEWLLMCREIDKKYKN